MHADLQKGGNTNRSQEHVLQSMYLNVHHDLRSLIPATLLFQSACHHRLGESIAQHAARFNVLLMTWDKVKHVRR